MAVLLMQSGDAARAEEHLLAALRHGAEPGRTHMLLGDALARQGREADALRQFLEVTRLHPGDARAWSNCAFFALSTGDAEAAIRHARRALELEPAGVDARVNLGAALERSGALEEAREEYRRVLAAVPGHPVATSRLRAVEERIGR